MPPRTRKRCSATSATCGAEGVHGGVQGGAGEVHGGAGGCRGCRLEAQGGRCREGRGVEAQGGEGVAHRECDFVLR